MKIQARRAVQIGIVKKMHPAVEMGKYLTDENIPWMPVKPAIALMMMSLWYFLGISMTNTPKLLTNSQLKNIIEIDFQYKHS